MGGGVLEVLLGGGGRAFIFNPSLNVGLKEEPRLLEEGDFEVFWYKFSVLFAKFMAHSRSLVAGSMATPISRGT